MAIGFVGLELDGACRCRDAALVLLLLFVCGNVPTQPVARTRQLPRRLEVFRVGGESRLPDISGLPRARQLLAIGVQLVGVLAVGLREAWGGDEKKADENQGPHGFYCHPGDCRHYYFGFRPPKKMCSTSFSFSQMFSMMSVSGSRMNGTVTDHGFVYALGSLNVNSTSRWP